MRRTPRHYSQLCLEHLNGKAQGAWSKFSLRFLLEMFRNIRVCCVHVFAGKNGFVSDVWSDFSMYSHMRYCFQYQHFSDYSQLSGALQYEGFDLVVLSCRGMIQNTTTCCDMCHKFSYAWLMWCFFYHMARSELKWCYMLVDLRRDLSRNMFTVRRGSFCCDEGANQRLLWVDGRAMTMTMTIHDPLCDWVDCWLGAPHK